MVQQVMGEMGLLKFQKLKKKKDRWIGDRETKRKRSDNSKDIRKQRKRSDNSKDIRKRTTTKNIVWFGKVRSISKILKNAFIGICSKQL